MISKQKIWFLSIIYFMLYTTISKAQSPGYYIGPSSFSFHQNNMIIDSSSRTVLPLSDCSKTLNAIVKTGTPFFLGCMLLTTAIKDLPVSTYQYYKERNDIKNRINLLFNISYFLIGSILIYKHEKITELLIRFSQQ